jgi:hypothetical protein
MLIPICLTLTLNPAENIQDANMEEQQSSLVDGLKTPTTVAGMSNHEHQLVDNHVVQNMIR